MNDGKRSTALLVDDEADVVHALERALHYAEFDVVGVTSVDAAWAVIRDHAVHVVVSDEEMPGVSGTDFLAAVRAHDPSIARIMLTGRATTDLAIAAVNRAEIFRFHVKPCAASVLAASIDDALAARAASTADSAFDDPEQTRAQTTLREGLRQSWLAIQPIVRATDRSIVAYEALIRADATSTSAAVLVEEAIRLGRELDLDRSVLDKVPDVLSLLPDHCSLFVNLFPQSFFELQHELRSAPLCNVADRVVLELTEHSIYATRPDLAEHLQALREVGFRIAIDDLGSGYSSLSTLELVAPDIVKLDAALVTDAASSPSKLELIRHLVDHNLAQGRLVVAEGIETEGDAEAMRTTGCDLVQGYHLGRPIDPRLRR
jgi:EAL domain-containing protein (putative c-di-GMP-specific phosphodiesterase class I)